VTDVVKGRVVNGYQDRRRTYWDGRVVLDTEDGKVTVRMPGVIAGWLTKGTEVKVEGRSIGDEVDVFEADVEIHRRHDDEWVQVWPPFEAEATLERTDVLGREVYRYELKFREAIHREDYEAIVGLEQYHYASEKDVVAVWRCAECGRTVRENIKPEKCPKCGSRNVYLWAIRGSLPASRFMVVELQNAEEYEPDIVAYVRVDPPIPKMNRRLPDGGVERNIREKVFGEDWFHPTFEPRRGKTVEDILHECDTHVARIARVVVHPEYRADGIGRESVRGAVRWIKERRIPEMKSEKHLVEVIAQMARYHPIFESVGFVYLWDTGSGRPYLVKPLTDEAKAKVREFLRKDPVARQHGGRLYVSRLRNIEVEPLEEPIRIEDLNKTFTTELDVSGLPEELVELLRAFGVIHRKIQQYVLQDVNLEIEPEKIYVVVGPSGAGKTTLARMIMGADPEFVEGMKRKLLEELSSPVVSRALSTLGVDVRELADELVKEMYEPDDGEVILPDNLKLAAMIPGEVEPEIPPYKPIIEILYDVTGDASLAAEILNRSGIADAVLYRSPYERLSPGQKERVRLARMIAEGANLLVIDEFCSHLDPKTAMRVARNFSSMCRELGITALIITHRPEVVDALAPDYMIYVGHGVVGKKRYGAD